MNRLYSEKAFGKEDLEGMKESLLRTNKEIAEIYERNADMVYKVAYLSMKNEQDACDVVQNVFVKYMSKNVVFNGLEHEKAWFITVTKNACKDLLRSSWFSKRRDIDEIENYRRPDNTSASNSELLELIKGLKPNYRIAVYFYYYEGYKVKEIAKLMNSKESTVQTWLAKARQELECGLKEDKLYG